MIRTFRPTDLVALVTFEGRALPNVAHTRHTLGRAETRPLPVAAILEQWLPFEGRRFTWVAVQGFSIHGLISARRRTGPSAWEIDWLIVDAQVDPEEIVRHLLNELAREGGEAGARKVFLRLPSDDVLTSAARLAGFWPFLTETLYRWDPSARPALGEHQLPLVSALRRKAKADDYGIFRLYNAAVPESVRRAHGVTFSDWREAQETSPGKRQEMVSVVDGKVLAWLALTRGRGTAIIDLMIDPQESNSTGALVSYALNQIGAKLPVWCLAPSHNVAVCRTLEEDPMARSVAEYTSMVKFLAVPVPAARLVPARA